MKTLTFVLVTMVAAGNLIAGPWYTHKEGIAGGDKVTNSIPLDERIYVFLRQAPPEEKRDRNLPVKILRAKDTKTIADVLKEMKGAYPKGYPNRLFVIVYRAEPPYGQAYNASVEKAGKADFKVQARDVIWIGFST